MNALVTGAAGFIGSHVVDELIYKKKYQVVALDDLSGGSMENVNKDAKFILGSVLDYDLVNKLFTNFRFDYVFHLAAYAAEGLSHFIKRFNYNNNLLGSVNLINASINAGTVKCFVFTSSIAVYGTNQLPMSEELIPMPEDSYGIAKLAVEQELKVSHEMFDLPYIIFRPHNVYGERQNISDPYRNVIGIFMNQAMQGRPFTIFGDGSQTRAFSHVDDVALIIARSIEHKAAYNEIYNIGAETPYTINSLAEVVAKSMGVELRVKHLDARKEVMHAYPSHKKARAIFEDWFRNVPLEEGVKRMAMWAKQCGSRESKPFTAIEISKCLPPSWTRFQQSP